MVFEPYMPKYALIMEYLDLKQFQKSFRIDLAA